MAGSAEFRLGTVLARSTRVYFRNLPTYAFLSLIAALPISLAILDVEPALDAEDTIEVVAMATYLLLGNVVTAVVVFSVFQQLGGRHPAFLRCVGVGLRAALPVIVLAFVITLFVTIGFLLLVVPGLMWMCMWYVAIPAAVIERKGIGEALRRSSALTSGRRWRILVLVIGAVGLAPFLWSVVFQWVLPDRDLTWSAWRLESIISEIFAAFVGTYFAVVSAVAYHALRVEKEGVSIEDLLAVFD